MRMSDKFFLSFLALCMAAALHPASPLARLIGTLCIAAMAFVTLLMWIANWD